ncbi:restriction endonuclease subunit S [Mycolicibacterium novocastrense]|nr:restriction endonuclease subunit S [Mycolicibacterium novocastrense]
MKPYGTYRKVDQRWLQAVPAEWSTTRLRYVCDIATGSGDTINAEPDGDYPFIVRSPVPLRANTFDYDGEAILTVGDGAVGEVFHHIRGGRFLAHQRVYILNNFRDIHTRYLYYYFSSLFRLMAQDGSARTTVDSVRRWMLTDMPVACPPYVEQRVIADYLDRETGRIDTLIEEQKRLIELLKHRKLAVLDEAATAAEGARIRLRNLFVPSSEANHPEEEVLSVYRDYGVIPKSSRDDNFNRTPENVERYLLVRPGDVVINRMKAWQGSLGVSGYRGIVSGDYEVLRPTSDKLLPRFTHLFLRSPLMIAEYAVRSTGIRPSQWRLYWDEMANIELCVPPRTQQAAIVERIDEQIAKIDNLITETERFIELARERRSALITAAVTGQIDVSGSAA